MTLKCYYWILSERYDARSPCCRRFKLFFDTSFQLCTLTSTHSFEYLLVVSFLLRNYGSHCFLTISLRVTIWTILNFKVECKTLIFKHVKITSCSFTTSNEPYLCNVTYFYFSSSYMFTQSILTKNYIKKFNTKHWIELSFCKRWKHNYSNYVCPPNKHILFYKLRK